MLRTSIVTLLFVSAFVACGSDEGGMPREQGGSSDPSRAETARTNDTNPSETSEGSSMSPTSSPDVGSTLPATQPSSPGDGVCDGTENAATVPQDCSAVLGDGYCTHSEDHISAPGECLPPDVDFMGGSLDELRSYSANLEFGKLNIYGDLILSPLDGQVTLIVADFTNDGGEIVYTQGSCEYRDAPDLSILASGHVEIAGGIHLYGKTGSGTTSTSTCRQCNGRRGGTVRVEANTLAVRAIIETWGGGGSRFVTSGVSVGCDGGSGGDVILTATSRIDYGPHRFSTEGGQGGYQTHGSGTDGADGVTTWSAPEVSVTELEPNGSQSLAQPLAFANNITVHGTASETDDQSSQSSSSALSITFDPSTGIAPDYVEDIYTFDVTQSGSHVILGTTVTNSQTDIDIYLANAATGQLLAQSNGADGYEQIQTSVPVGTYIVLVSWVSGSPTNYSLSVRPYLF